MTAILICAVFLAMVASFYSQAEDDAYEKASSMVSRMSNNEFLIELEPQENGYDVRPLD